MIYPQIRDEFLSHRKIKALQYKGKSAGWTQNCNEVWNQKDLDLLKQGIDEGLTFLEIVEKYLPNRTDRALRKKAHKQGFQKRAKPWLKNELFLLDLGLFNGLSLPQIQKQSLPHRPLLHLQARIKVPNWNKVRAKAHRIKNCFG
eukprot:TRINITY_DN16756_c0_g1_i2.p3 TRINITY_DN16756_c0_g1~~TRINITY_DN16756_c0_g1_i2.p3  ORF type:complete len:145 (+),score=3.11 TRINITY_DN16756_c0_g1_i2:399-833(+)